MHYQASIRVTLLAMTAWAVSIAQNYPNYHYGGNNYDYHYQYGPQPDPSKSSNYLDHYNSISNRGDSVKDHYNSINYHNLSGYPQHSSYFASTTPLPEYDYYNYDYSQYEAEVTTKKPGTYSPHPLAVSLKKLFNGIQNRQVDLGFLSGNTIYLVVAIILGIIGVGGLIVQFGSGFIAQFTKEFDDLKARLTAVENRSTASTGATSTVSQAQVDSLTAKVTAMCTTLTAVTGVPVQTTGADDTANNKLFIDMVAAIADPTC